MIRTNSLVMINTETCDDRNLLEHKDIVFRITTFVEQLAILQDVKRYSCGGTTIIFGVRKEHLTPYVR